MTPLARAHFAACFGDNGDRRRHDAPNERGSMKLSTDRILTTHVGSLPRDTAVLELLYKKENGEPYDAERFDAADRSGRRRGRRASSGQPASMSSATAKPARSATRPTSRTGSSGFARPLPAAAAPRPRAAIPSFAKRWRAMIGKQTFKRAALRRPVELTDRDAVHKDIANLKRGVASAWRARRAS